MTGIDRAEDRKAIEDLMRAMEDAWGAHDADAYGATFTADATYTTWVGTVYTGRDDIAGSHRVLWRKFLKGSTLHGETTGVRFLAPDVAVLTSRGAVGRGGRRPKKLDKVQTYTLVREDDGRWRVAAFHNTKHKAVGEAISFMFAAGLKPQADR